MKLDKELQKSINGLRWKIDTFFFLAIVLAVAALGIYILHFIFSTEINGFFSGDGTDIVNGFTLLLASISGVLFVYIAFLGQQWQLIYQQQEIRDNREEMQKSTAQLEIQGKALTEQINKMDRDFIHQNFFRILEQHFKTRDRVEYSYKEYVPNSTSYSYVTGKNEKAFHYFFRELRHWINDDNDGWGRKMNLKEEDKFLIDYGFAWYKRRPELKKSINIIGEYFRENRVPLGMLSKPEITFVFRATKTDSSFGPYLRSCYYLFGYMKKNNLKEYLDAVDAGMGKYERSFLFYKIATRFEIDDRIDIKHWLMDNFFLSNIEPRHLLSPNHIELLYPIGSGPEFKRFKNPHP